VNQSAFEWLSPSVSRFRPDAPQTFEEYHRTHPQVYRGLRDLALEVRRAGRQRIGMKLLIERLRWDHMLTGCEEDEWKVNNNHASRYARLLMESEPELAGLFELRELRT
tara:strand:- start:7636 stop:7962 length:327 start_codon:yes stop_codon:yes gene_type:complete